MFLRGRQRPHPRPPACKVRRKAGAEEEGPSSQSPRFSVLHVKNSRVHAGKPPVCGPPGPSRGRGLDSGPAFHPRQHPLWPSSLSFHTDNCTFVPWMVSNSTSIWSPEQGTGPPDRPAAGLGRAEVTAGAGRPFPCLPHSPLPDVHGSERRCRTGKASVSLLFVREANGSNFSLSQLWG